jgi:hypothetical protein
MCASGSNFKAPEIRFILSFRYPRRFENFEILIKKLKMGGNEILINFVFEILVKSPNFLAGIIRLTLDLLFPVCSSLNLHF